MTKEQKLQDLIKKQEAKLDKDFPEIWSENYKKSKFGCYMNNSIKNLISDFRKETIEFERQRIKIWAEKLVEEETKLFGTDKHGISLHQIKEFLK